MWKVCFVPQWTFTLSCGEKTLEKLGISKSADYFLGQNRKKAGNSKSNKQSMKEKDNQAQKKWKINKSL